MPIECKCIVCGTIKKLKPFSVKRGRGKFCSKKCQYEYMSKNSCGINNPNYGNKWPDDKKIMFSQSRIGDKNPFYNKLVSIEHKNKLRIYHTGPKCVWWKGGISFEPYCFKFNGEFKERVRSFWDYKCGECHKPSNNGKKLSVHHVHYDKMSCKMFIPLCGSCHSKTNHNREHYEKKYENLINEQFGGKSYYTQEEFLIKLNQSINEQIIV